MVAGSLHGRTGAYLIVRDAASRVEVRLAELPGLLYRISTPADSGLAPRVTGGAGRVRLGLRPTGDDGPDTVTILLNRAVRWDIRLPAGAGEQRLDLAGGSVARVDLGSSGLLDIAAAAAARHRAGHLARWGGYRHRRAPRDAPVRFRLWEGARLGGYAVGGEQRVPSPGAVLADPAWSGGGRPVRGQRPRRRGQPDPAVVTPDVPAKRPPAFRRPLLRYQLRAGRST